MRLRIILHSIILLPQGVWCKEYFPASNALNNFQSQAVYRRSWSTHDIENSSLGRVAFSIVVTLKKPGYMFFTFCVEKDNLETI